MKSIDMLINENNRIISNLQRNHISYEDDSYNIISESLICLLTIENEILLAGRDNGLSELYINNFQETTNKYFFKAKSYFEKNRPKNYEGDIGNNEKERRQVQHDQKHPIKDTTSTVSIIIQELIFNKENGIWYIDLPEFIELGLGNKNNLMMVDGADTFLDKISNNGTTVKVKVSTKKYDGFEARISMINKGMNQDLLVQKGHAPVDYGAYYKLDVFNGAQSDHILWLCPVTEYVFGGSYPEKIWINVIK
jgi:hypothetical protein